MRPVCFTGFCLGRYRHQIIHNPIGHQSFKINIDNKNLSSEREHQKTYICKLYKSNFTNIRGN